MIESIFALLMTSPALSIVLGFTLAITLAILFRKTIEAYLIKKFDLYTAVEVKEAVQHSFMMEEDNYKTLDKMNLNQNKFINDVVDNLKN